MLSLLHERGISAVHTAPDALARWWEDRGNARIKDVRLGDGKLTFTVRTLSPSGVVVKVPLGSDRAFAVKFPHRIVEKFGRQWLMVVIPPGETRVEVQLD